MANVLLYDVLQAAECVTDPYCTVLYCVEGDKKRLVNCQLL
jgi:hypothetical protein